MATISNLEQRVADRLEQPAADPLKFWSVQDELRVFLVEAFNEATLITGEPQSRSGAPVTLVANSTFQTMPAGALALLKIESSQGLGIRKTSIWDLDRHQPSWQNDTGPDILHWFPFGLLQFGIYPKLTADVQANLSYVLMPVTAARPYTGAETVPFQQEFFDGFEEAAAHFARLKEGGPDFSYSMREYERFLLAMGELSNFAIRKDALRFTRAMGVVAKVAEVETR